MGAGSLREEIVLFTRYPLPGHTKTRLIPALGPAGAASLHRRMTEHMVAVAMSSVRTVTGRRLTVAYTGCEAAAIRDWLGPGPAFTPQRTGDLGARMAAGFEAAFADGAETCVIVGTDCPAVDAGLLEQAFAELPGAGLVLGPAADGGYYLIGIARHAWPAAQALFEGIVWGTETVFEATCAAAHRVGLTPALLPCLSDIDRPDDLSGLASTAAVDPVLAAEPRLSVIIPVLNEADQIEATLAAALTGENVEILVADGGSCDGTRARAIAAGVRVLETAAGRACQMNAGAARSSGEILLFLHGDTRLPLGYDSRVRQAVAGGATAGAFRLAIEAPGWGLRLIAWGANCRSQWAGMPYGDQALFATRARFRATGGFPDILLMEDYEFVRQLRRDAPAVLLPVAVRTSARRWQQHGILRTLLLNQAIVAAYHLGVPPARLAAWYRRA